MFPKFKLGLIFANIARKHGGKVLHANNPALLIHDLGEALRQQRNVLSDPRKGMAITAYDVLPAVIEVKILTMVTAKSLNIDTKGKADIQILEEIVEKAKENNYTKYAKEIEETLDWTRKLFANPEIQDVLATPMTELDTPKNLSDVTKFITSLGKRSVDEVTRLNEFVKRMKDSSGPGGTGPTPQAPKT